MNTIQVYPDVATLAEAAAAQSIETLRTAITAYDTAIWVLAGGTAPLLAYDVIAARYRDALDWSRVACIIGDERIVPLDSPESNWQQAAQHLLQYLPVTAYRPSTDQPADVAARQYDDILKRLPRTPDGAFRLDLVWLGMGEDGHTLSLFPERPELTATDRYVLPIYDAPKPPTERISLSLQALAGAQATFILTNGAAKSYAFHKAQVPNSTLPIAQAARLTQATWLIDASVNGA